MFLGDKLSILSLKYKPHYLYSNKDLKRLIVPLILEQALAITVGMADSMMISSAGDSAVAGVTLVDMLNVLMISILSAVATGGAVVVGQNLGAKNRDGACNAARQLMFSVSVFSIGITSIVLGFRQGLLKLFFGSIEPDVHRAALTYLTISAFSFPFLGIYNSCAALFRNMGKTNVTFVVSIIGNAINVVGNAVCIFVFKMGVAGVALPTLISRAVMAVILFVILLKPTHEVNLCGKGFRPDFSVIKKILHIGIPGGIENGIFQLGRVLVISIISEYGTTQTAAMGVSNTFGGLGCIMGQAMNLAMIAVIGKCVGAEDKDQIRYYLKKLMIITYVGMIITNTLILALLGPLLSVYQLTPEATQLAAKLIWIHDGIAMLLWPMSFTMPNMLRAANDVKFAMIISIFSMFVFRIGFSHILGTTLDMGVVGVQLAMIIDWIFRIILFTARYCSGAWKRTMYVLK